MYAEIRNAVLRRKPEFVTPYSILKHRIAEVLAREGFIRAAVEAKGPHGKSLVLKLKYLTGGEPAISGIEQISKPSRRVYSSVADLPLAERGVGITIVTTSKGVLTDKEARVNKTGGEVLCKVW